MGEFRHRTPIADIIDERKRQHARWGEQNHPDGTGPEYEDFARDSRDICQEAAANGSVSWLDILQEEVAEAYAETDPEKLRTELIQVAAVAVAWVEAIDRRKQS